MIGDFWKSVSKSAVSVLETRPHPVQFITQGVSMFSIWYNFSEPIFFLQELDSFHCDFIKISSNHYVGLAVNQVDPIQDPFELPQAVFRSFSVTWWYIHYYIVNQGSLMSA